jgi:hypothetical protein
MRTVTCMDHEVVGRPSMSVSEASSVLDVKERPRGQTAVREWDV